MNSVKESNIDLSNNSLGLKISLDNNELLIKGSKLDLIELADYINSVALSEKEKDHLHIDDLTLIDSNSSIKNLIIEKE